MRNETTKLAVEQTIYLCDRCAERPHEAQLDRCGQCYVITCSHVVDKCLETPTQEVKK